MEKEERQKLPRGAVLKRRYGTPILGILALALSFALIQCRPRPKNSIPYPLVLVHGFGGGGRVWAENYQVVDFLEAHGLRFGGILSIEDGRVIRDRRSLGSDFYAVNFTDNLASVSTQAKELSKFLSFIRKDSRCPKALLVGFSMGGVVCRQYLVTHLRNHGIVKLVTIGSPHLGTPLALSYDLKQWLRTHSRVAGDGALNSAQVVGIELEIKALDAIESQVRQGLALKRFALDCPALADLRPPRRSDYGSYADGLLPGTTFLYRLNAARHPQDVEYACIVGDLGNDQNLQDILRNAREAEHKMDTPRLLARLLYPLGNLAVGLFGASRGGSPIGRGDGIVGTDSQDLRNTSFFQGRRRLVSVFRISGVGHLEECWYHDVLKAAIGAEYLNRVR